MKKARLMLISSMAIFGTIGAFVRNIPVSSGELALYRAVLASVLIGMYLLLTKQKIPFGNIKKELPLLLISGVAMGFNWILLFQAYKYTTISVATLSYYFAPVLVTAACPFLFKEKLTGKQILCFIMSTAGIVLITGVGDFSSGNSNIIGIFMVRKGEFRCPTGSTNKCTCQQISNKTNFICTSHANQGLLYPVI